MSDEMLARIGTIAAIVVFLVILTKLGFKLKDFIANTAGKTLTLTGNTLLKIHNKNIQKAAITSKNTFAKSKFYKKIEQMIFDLGLNDVTVEGFMFFLIFISAIAACALLLLSRSIPFAVLGGAAILIFIYTLAYMSASEGHFKREFAIMDAVDLIIVNMKDGVLKAVKENIDLFHPLVRPDFEMFVADMYEYKIPVEEALESLGERLGPSFTKFKEKAKEFEAKGRAGMLETFQDDMNENMYRRMDLRELMDTIREANLGFALAMGVCGFLSFAIFGTSEKLRLLIFTTTGGRIILMINIILIVGSFAYLQHLREDKRG